MEMANLAGFTHAGTPVMTRGSMKIPTTGATNVTSMTAPRTVSGRLSASTRLISGCTVVARLLRVRVVPADDFIVRSPYRALRTTSFSATGATGETERNAR